jgi:ankyrin repeat protein
MSFSDEEFHLSGLVSEDVKIDLARQTRAERRKERRRRIEQLRANPNLATTSSQSITLDNSLEEENSSTDRFMDLELCRAATKDDADGFIDALERISKEKKLPLPAIFEQVSPFGNTYLHIAASFNNCKTVLLIVDLAPWLLSKKNSKGDTVLHILARAGHQHTVMGLVLNLEHYEHSSFGNGYKPESESATLRAQNEEGNNVLHEALIHEHEMLASFLFAFVRLDPEALYDLNKEGKSALYLATEAGFFVCVSLLLDKIIEYENQFGKLKGKSPVHAAIIKRNTGMLLLTFPFTFKKKFLQN